MNNHWQPKVWITISLGILLQPFMFLYLNRKKVFWLYFFVYCTVAALDWRYHTAYIALFILICPIHGYLITKSYQSSTKRAWYAKGWGVTVIYFSFLMSMFLFRSFLFEPFLLPGRSMEPTIAAGNSLVINKIGYRTYGSHGVMLFSSKITAPELMQPGHVYAFQSSYEDIPLVKRLIARPGDTVSVIKHNVFINGQPLHTSLVKVTAGARIYEQQLGGVSYHIQHLNVAPYQDMTQIRVPDESYFFMGDNRDNSADSRHWGVVASDKIIGKVVYSFE